MLQCVFIESVLNVIILFQALNIRLVRQVLTKLADPVFFLNTGSRVDLLSIMVSYPSPDWLSISLSIDTWPLSIAA